MSRSLVSLRRATVADAPVLAELWGEALRRVDHAEQVADLTRVLTEAERDASGAGAASGVSRVLVAEYDGEVAGAVLLRVSTLSPLNLEPCVQAVSPHVFAAFRRRGVGRALMDGAVVFAEERGIDHVMTAANSVSRDANRFMARLALGPHAMLRVAPTAAVRAKLTTSRSAMATSARAERRQVTRVLAARRSMRRAQAQAQSQG
ncbi:GNAT family N-acetyltransferase [Nocardioides nanhaiensis]|uniref:N-acetyltransferase domain-containing protein n=1 Tax=Nocardioides nanhaiensis TaxID=1476871 RepID=A0ABP8WYF5_9ACTN